MGLIFFVTKYCGLCLHRTLLLPASNNGNTTWRNDFPNTIKENPEHNCPQNSCISLLVTSGGSHLWCVTDSASKNLLARLSVVSHPNAAWETSWWRFNFTTTLGPIYQQQNSEGVAPHRGFQLWWLCKKAASQTRGEFTPSARAFPRYGGGVGVLAKSLEGIRRIT